MAVTVRTVSCSVVFASVTLTNVIEARGQESADSGWPTCSVFVTAKPGTGNEEDALVVTAGAGNNVVRHTGRVRRFRSSNFPKAIELVSMGTLGYAAEWAPDEDLAYDPTTNAFISAELVDIDGYAGATDQELIMGVLDLVPRLGSGSYTSGEILGTSTSLGTEAPEAFVWKKGTSGWSYIQNLDRATLYRTYQTRDGSIKRVRMIGHPNTSDDFTLADVDVLPGSTGSRDTERTRNAVLVTGHDYGDGEGPVLGVEYGSFTAGGVTYDGSVATQRFPEVFSSDLIEEGLDLDGVATGRGGLDADALAALLLPDVLKEFVDADVQSWRDDTHGPGLTCLLDCLNRLAIGESMWVQRYGWQVTDGWYSTYGLSGGGTEQTYTPPEV